MDEAKLEAIVKQAVAAGVAEAHAKLLAEASVETDLRTYQHAADWVRMANSITWTVASIYLVSAVLAMNTALSRPSGSHERLMIGKVWLALLVIWLLVDGVYLLSARHARKTIETIEGKSTFRGPQFYTDQRRTRWLQGNALNVLLVASALTIGYLWYEVTWVWVDPPPSKIQLLNPP